MSTRDTLEAAGRQVGQLRECVESMQANLGETVDVQRLKEDVTRLAADLSLLARANGLGPATAQPSEIIYICDEDYDPSFWAGADDEGLGANGRAG